MNGRTIFLILAACFVVMAGGSLLIILSFSPSIADQFNSRGFRALGLCTVFLGLGEFLNHLPPRRESHSISSLLQESEKKYRRTPCGLGNFIEVLALISFFAVIAIFFFPHEP